MSQKIRHTVIEWKTLSSNPCKYQNQGHSQPLIPRWARLKSISSILSVVSLIFPQFSSFSSSLGSSGSPAKDLAMPLIEMNFIVTTFDKFYPHVLVRKYTPRFFRPAMWVSYCTVPLWLLQVTVPLREL